MKALNTQVIGDVQQPRFLARLCWNECRWIRPSGFAGKHEQTAQTGFGYSHDEWMFSPQARHDGFQYGFITGIWIAQKKWSSRSKIMKMVDGGPFSLECYAICPRKRRWIVARVQNCRALSENEAKDALSRCKASGDWLDRLAQIRAVNGSDGEYRKVVIHTPLAYFNVRFPYDQSAVLESPLPASAAAVPSRFGRYSLVALSADKRTERITATRGRLGRRAAANSRVSVPRVRRAIGELIVDPKEERLMKALEADINHRRLKGITASREEDWRDLTVCGPRGVAILECKYTESARSAICQGAGQLFLYASRYANTDAQAVHLCIGSPNPLLDEDIQFISWMGHRGLRIEYADLTDINRAAEFLIRIVK